MNIYGGVLAELSILIYTRELAVPKMLNGYGSSFEASLFLRQMALEKRRLRKGYCHVHL